MGETPFQHLSVEDRRLALRKAEAESPHPAFLLEKDIWVVATLHVLFEAPFGRHLVFKGGTSLTKVWGAIRRFSEDIDITYDIRSFAPDLVATVGDEALPPTRSQERRWTRAIRPRLAEWVRDRAGPLVEEELARAGFVARIRAEAERLYIRYKPLFEIRGIVRPEDRLRVRRLGQSQARSLWCRSGGACRRLRQHARHRDVARRGRAVRRAHAAVRLNRGEGQRCPGDRPMNMTEISDNEELKIRNM